MDTRYETFITLCRLMNYRKTSEEMNLTQPAVTRQIQSLEEELKVRLFIYDHRKLKRTKASVILENYILSLRHNYDCLREELLEPEIKTIRVGATKTIGDYIIFDAVKKYLSDPNKTIVLRIDNTAALLEDMKGSKLDFAIVEGIFDKSKYGYRLLRKDNFTGICSKDHRFSGKTVEFKDIYGEDIIIRENGSGTRDILERELQNRGHSLDMFKRCIEISSFAMISDLVSDKIGISFTYDSVIKDRTDIGTFNVKGFELIHEFNIVWLRESKIPEEGEEFLQNI